jgi:ubiquinone biosynthesis accessory factor UbiJ
MLRATLGNLLNRGLPRSPRARQLVAELEGRTLDVAVRDLLTLRVSSNGQTLDIGVPRSDAAASATVSGGPLSLLALSGDAGQAVIQRGDVRISGDTEVAQSYRELAQLLRPDLEEELSLVIGDVPAHQLARLARLGGRFGQRAADTTLRNLAEYLGHERADLVSRNEGEEFLHGVDAVREAVDRLEARLDVLARRYGAS